MKESRISEDIIDVITDKVASNDYFLEVQEQLNTPHKRIKYVRDHMKYVAPIEKVLNKSEVLQGRSKDVIHYVPLTESIKNLFEDPSCIKMMKQIHKKTVLMMPDSEKAPIPVCTNLTGTNK